MTVNAKYSEFSSEASKVKNHVEENKYLYGSKSLSKILTKNTKGKDGKELQGIEYIGRVFKNLGDVLHVKFARLMSSFSEVKWVGNKAIRQELNSKIDDLTQAVNGKSISASDKEVIASGVAEMKAVCFLLKQRGVKDIESLELRLDKILDKKFVVKEELEGKIARQRATPERTKKQGKAETVTKNKVINSSLERTPSRSPAKSEDHSSPSESRESIEESRGRSRERSSPIKESRSSSRLKDRALSPVRGGAGEKTRGKSKSNVAAKEEARKQSEKPIGKASKKTHQESPLEAVVKDFTSTEHSTEQGQEVPKWRARHEHPVQTSGGKISVSPEFEEAIIDAEKSRLERYEDKKGQEWQTRQKFAHYLEKQQVERRSEEDVDRVRELPKGIGDNIVTDHHKQLRKALFGKLEPSTEDMVKVVKNRLNDLIRNAQKNEEFTKTLGQWKGSGSSENKALDSMLKMEFTPKMQYEATIEKGLSLIRKGYGSRIPNEVRQDIAELNDCLKSLKQKAREDYGHELARGQRQIFPRKALSSAKTAGLDYELTFNKDEKRKGKIGRNLKKLIHEAFKERSYSDSAPMLHDGGVFSLKKYLNSPDVDFLQKVHSNFEKMPQDEVERIAEKVITIIKKGLEDNRIGNVPDIDRYLNKLEDLMGELQ